VSAPRLFLVPQWTDVEWTIRPRLEEWAEVASYDPARAAERGPVTRESLVELGLEQLDALGWDSFFIAADTFGTGTAMRIVRTRRDDVRGVALGHACASWDMEGERAPVRKELWEAMAQLMHQDLDSFVRYGITQLTQGSFDEDVSRQMVERVPTEHLEAVWTLIREHPEPIGELLAETERPLLLAKHDGCLMFTDEGFDDLRAAFPDACTMTVAKAPCADEEFARALREFCDG
jgi:hypothetical protein